MQRFEWFAPGSAQDAAKSAGSTVQKLMTEGAGKSPAENAVIKAGGIDLLDLLKEGILPASRLINIRCLQELRSIKYTPGQGANIGPLLTLSQIEANPNLQKQHRALTDAASHIATPNIRNAATIGGNLLQRPRCWYFRSSDFHCLKKGGEHCFAIDGENKYHAIFDNNLCAIVHPSTIAVALVALEAQLEILSADGKKRTVPVEEFFISPAKDVQRENRLGPNELIVAILLPDNKLHSAHLKLGEKDSYDWSITDCAAALAMNGKVCKKASIIIGAVAPIPWRANEAEAFLAGKEITPETAKAAAALAVKGAAPLSQNAYKVDLVHTVVSRTILAALK